MPMRVTGMFSGLDTESIIQELVAVKQSKVDDAKKAQTKLKWKQEAWKDLNTKLRNLQNKYLNNMRFADAYSKKTTKVSNDSIVSIITGENAVNGVQSLQVKQLAKTGYLTGAKISGKDGKELTALSKLSEIKIADGMTGITGEGTITVKSGDKSVDIKVTEETTISDVLTQLKNVGLNASFDAKQQRFFISAKESGEANDFSITASDANGAAALSALGLQTSLKDDEATLKEYKEYAAYFKDGDRAATLANMKSLIDGTVSSRTASYLDEYKKLVSSKEAAEKKIAELEEKYKDSPLKSADEYQKELDAKAEEIKKVEESLKSGNLNPEEAKEAEEKLTALREEEADLNALKKDAETLASQKESVQKSEEQMAEIKTYVDITSTTEADGTVTYSAAATAKLVQEVEDRYYDKAAYANQVIKDYNAGNLASSGATKISGQDAVINLNGAEFTGNSNVFEINGLTFTALSETKGDETVTITTQDDTDGIYDMVKNFLKEYNSLVNEMDKLYNADPAKGYEPLTDEEKDALSESEAEEWEKKVKDALLRRDSNLSSVNSAIQAVMSAGIEVNGKTMYLHDFGIDTLGYFNASDNEKHAYHIDGDPDDEFTSANADKLKGMISNDPDTVISFFSQLSKNLYDEMTDLSKSVKDYRSYGSFYDDKKMQEEYNDYTSKIADLEKKLADYEDKWYAKFSAMETALAKMQSNASAITGLLGG